MKYARIKTKYQKVIMNVYIHMFLQFSVTKTALLSGIITAKSQSEYYQTLFL